MDDASACGPDDASDEDLFARFVAGDDAALEALVRRHARGAARFAAEIVRDAHEGEDVAQESFLRLVSGPERSGFDPRRGRFAPFFFRIVRNLAIDRARSRRAGSNGLDAAIEAPDGARAESRAERDEAGGKVASLLRALPDGERSALVLREFEGLSYRDVAEVLGASLETVKMWIFRARQKLARGYAAAAAPEEGLRSGL